ncbi:type II toxin-antitoxin system PemK/MazF family toxin [Streptomyces phaeochromogenes]|uniref:type II toxin-antitoxin system PemK/MazF family toxin n=1 Tax=Streptomyces phaeochromogenes TaxID=1923 RepID=UPI003866FBFD|nr:type II toxin-antitoxin system PemK/MazF family toxin [Streptomyces phaeochromogenes]
MNTSWWLALAAVVLLAGVATVVDGWGRRGRRGPSGGQGRSPGRLPGRPPGRPRAGGGLRRPSRPRPAEIWWANVPFEDGPGAKDRPCLVLSVRGRTAVVAKITSRSPDERRAGVIPLPPGSVGDARGRASFLETDELRGLPVRDFRRRVGPVDPSIWNQVRNLTR